jgi:hypothetical protein
MRRSLVAVAAAGFLVACSGAAADDATSPSLRPVPRLDPNQVPTEPESDAQPAAEVEVEVKPRAELPRGGRTIFPEHRLIGFSGGRGESFGRLGIGDIDDRAAELEELAAEYTGDGETPLPIFELIAIIAHGSPTESGLYRTREPAEVIDEYLAAARRHDALLVLNVQPGRADFIDDVRALEPWLLEPDVGLALDPEWAVGSNQVPGRNLGWTTGEELDSVASYLSGLVREHDLPEKVLIYHQFHVTSVRDEDDLRPHPGIVLVKSVDGVGVPQEKVATWNRLTEDLPHYVYSGFKLFFDEDTRRGLLMEPAEVLGLRPQPSYVLYE